MTLQRIYIRGDVGDPTTVHVFNADSNTELHLRALSLDISSGLPTATITEINTTMPISVKVVPAPPVPHAGKSLREVELTKYRRDPPQVPSGQTIHKATATEWIVQPDGSVKPNLKTQAYQQHTVDDVVLAAYRGDPKEILEDSARIVLTAMANFLISPMLSTGKAPLQTGGPVGYQPGAPNPNIPSKTKPNPFKIKSVAFVPKGGTGTVVKTVPADCEECGGSGEWRNPANPQLPPEPCSRGCKRPEK